MARSKYPPFDRVTAGRLAIGDRILIRDRATDHLWIEGFASAWDPETRTWVGGRSIPTGIHEVTDVYSWLQAGRRRSTRYYRLHLIVAGSDEPVAVVGSSVLRFNRVVES